MSTINIPNARLMNFSKQDKELILKRFENEHGNFVMFRVMEERYGKNPLPHMIKVNSPDLIKQLDKMDLQFGDYLTIDGEYDIKVSTTDYKQHVMVIAYNIRLSHESWVKRKKEKKENEEKTQSDTVSSNEIDLSECDIFRTEINGGT